MPYPYGVVVVIWQPAAGHYGKRGGDAARKRSNKRQHF